MSDSTYFWFEGGAVLIALVLIIIIDIRSKRKERKTGRHSRPEPLDKRIEQD